MKILQHIAIIMDGNRRWARARGLPAMAGHAYVADKLIERLVERAADRGVKYMTFWAWSTENWQRKKYEVSGILRLFRRVLSKGVAKLNQQGVRLKVIGDIDSFPKDIKEEIEDSIEETKNNQRITVILALSYGGRDELLRAFTKFTKNLPLTTNNLQRLTAVQLSQYLDTAGIPDPDMIIRPGGEKRLSGFLLWQSEYSELYFTDVLMPDFDADELDKAIEEYSRRQRRFGK